MLEVRPLYEWDGWAIWATKARALYDFGGAYGPVFTTYPPVQHPLFLPALEAIDFHVLGRFDGTLLHVQLGFLGFGFAAALWTLLRERVPAALAGLALLAIVSATAFVKQLSTNYADVPLALFVALGAVCLARWLDEGERTLLPAAALFLGAATLTKPEGLLFALAAILAALVAGKRERLRGTLVAGAAVALVLLPWRIFTSVHHLKNPEYSLGNAVDPAYLYDHADRLGAALRSVAGHAFSFDWGLLVPLGLAAIALAFLTGRTRPALFASLWTLLSFAGIVLVFWISVVPIDLTLRWAAYRRSRRSCSGSPRSRRCSRRTPGARSASRAGRPTDRRPRASARERSPQARPARRAASRTARRSRTRRAAGRPARSSSRSARA